MILYLVGDYLAKNGPKDLLHLGEKAKQEKRKYVLEAISEGKKMEIYTEHRTKDMKTCFLCETVVYRRKKGKFIGKKFICIDCLRELKETMENFKRWEEEVALENEMKKQLDDGLENG